MRSGKCCSIECSRLRRACEELTKQLVKTAFSAQVFCPRTMQALRSPVADAQLSRLSVCNKPVVRFAPLRATDVARYGLSDHSIPFTAPRSKNRIARLDPTSRIVSGARNDALPSRSAMPDPTEPSRTMLIRLRVRKPLLSRCTYMTTWQQTCNSNVFKQKRKDCSRARLAALRASAAMAADGDESRRQRIRER